MRPERLQNLLNSAINSWLRTKDSKRISVLLPSMRKTWKRWAKDEDDYRGGNLTYGYSNTKDIENNMMYISDRWRCAFRLKWIIDGVENGSI